MITVNNKIFSEKWSDYEDLFSNVRLKDSQPKLPKHNMIFHNHQNEFNSIVFSALTHRKEVRIVEANEVASVLKNVGWKSDSQTLDAIYLVIAPDGSEIIEWSKTMDKVITFYFIYPNMLGGDLVIPFTNGGTANVKPRPEEDF